MTRLRVGNPALYKRGRGRASYAQRPLPNDAIERVSYPSRTMTISDTTKPLQSDHRLVLAPMEGVMDSLMRAVLTDIGGYDRCVTEFIRVSQTVLPAKVFHRLCPELKNGGRTPSGVPVYLQLLGNNPKLMASNAQVAAKLGAPGIDLNFGCPAKTVNKSCGGAVLLQTPGLLGDICAAVRDAVPASVPVTAKIRLGFEDDSHFEEIVGAAIGGGINELTVHARTRRQAYRPPAHWHRLADVAQQAPITVIANGELWSPADVTRCAELSGCQDFMLARGALCRPNLGVAVKAQFAGKSAPDFAWIDVVPLLRAYLHDNAATYEPKYACNSVKQWLVYLQYYYPQAGALFARVKRLRDFQEMDRALAGAFGTMPAAA